MRKLFKTLKPVMLIILSTFLYFSSISSQNLKKEVPGKQSSSSIIPCSTCSKNQDIDPDTASLQPRFCSLKRVCTSQSQSILLSICILSFSTMSFSSFLLTLAPSEAMKSWLGFTFLISSKTFNVKSGRLKIKKSIGVCSLYADSICLLNFFRVLLVPGFEYGKFKGETIMK